ncbi:MAG: rod shape-determining protein MreC [Luteolibacter sp.]
MKPINLIALLLFLSGALWALTRSDRVVRGIQASYYSAISPFLRTGSSLETSAREFLSDVKSAKVLQQELDQTRDELARLKLIESRFHSLEAENNELRKALDFKQSAGFRVIAAHVTRRNPTTWWQTIEIDAGTNDGVQQHLMVLSKDGLVGIVDRTHPCGKISSVLLLTDEKCQVASRVDGSPEVGILCGHRGTPDGDALLRLRFLSPNAAVHQGQRVFTSGRGGVFAADILLGTIDSVEKGALDSEALVRPSVNFADLGAVFVVLPADS